MKVKELIIELQRFDGELDCFAYEGEVSGVIIEGENKQGVIYCNESNEVKDTELI